MKNAQTLLTNYVTPEGLPFEFLEGEEILVDSFSYISNYTKVTFIGFLTNYRFILKQSNFSLSGYGAEESFHADCRFIWLKDVKKIYLHKRGIGHVLYIDGPIVDFSKAEKTSEDDDAAIGKGVAGGLSYYNQEHFLSVLGPALNKVATENDFIFVYAKKPAFSVATEDQIKEFETDREETNKGLRRLAYVGVAFLTSPLWLYGLLSLTGNVPSDEPQLTEQPVIEQPVVQQPVIEQPVVQQFQHPKFYDRCHTQQSGLEVCDKANNDGSDSVHVGYNGSTAKFNVVCSTTDLPNGNIRLSWKYNNLQTTGTGFTREYVYNFSHGFCEGKYGLG